MSGFEGKLAPQQAGKRRGWRRWFGRRLIEHMGIVKDHTWKRRISVSAEPAYRVRSGSSGAKGTRCCADAFSHNLHATLTIIGERQLGSAGPAQPEMFHTVRRLGPDGNGAVFIGPRLRRFD